MPAKPKAIEIKLQGNQWLMKNDTGGWVKPEDYPVFKVDEDEVGLLKFQITGSGNTEFAPVPFVQKAGANPFQPDFADQFIVLKRGPKEILVIDVNQAKGGGAYNGGKYEYQLQFTNNVDPLDPIITNNGCCRLFFQQEAFAYGIIAAALFTLAILGIRRLFAR